MSVLSEFFVMSAVELPTRFPGWLAVRAEVSIREVVNPFTGKKTAEKTWLAAVDSVMPAAEPAVPDLGSVTRVAFRGIDHVKLAKLIMLMKGGDFKTRIEQLARPALIAPAKSDEMGLHRIDDEFAAALAGLDDSRVAKTAAECAKTEEMWLARFTAADCEIALCELAKLAQRAKLTAEGLYFYWSL